MTRIDLSPLSPDEKDDLILALFQQVRALEARLTDKGVPSGPGKTPRNSSLAPSRGQKANKPPRQKKPRKKRDRPGTTRQLTQAPDAVVDSRAGDCPHCGTKIADDAQSVREAYDHIDLPPVRPVVTRVRIWGCRCPGCRRRVRGASPSNMPSGTPFGPRIHVLLSYLHHQHAVGYQRLSAMMAELFGLSISEGAIANALRRGSDALTATDLAIRNRLRRATVIGCDETGARLTTGDAGTRMAWEWVLVSDDAVLHRIAPTRGRGVIEEVLGDHRPRVWVSDRWAAQQGHGDGHQVCLAHVLRDVQYALDAGEVPFAGSLRKLLCWAIAVGRRRADLKPATLVQYRQKADRRLDRLLAMPVITAQGQQLRAQTLRWRSQFFVFMTDPEVPPTNNAAERALRPSVIFRKVTNGFRSEWGAQVHASIRSAIGTGRLHGLSAYQAIQRALRSETIFAT